MAARWSVFSRRAATAFTGRHGCLGKIAASRVASSAGVKAVVCTAGQLGWLVMIQEITPVLPW